MTQKNLYVGKLLEGRQSRKLGGEYLIIESSMVNAEIKLNKYATLNKIKFDVQSIRRLHQGENLLLEERINIIREVGYFTLIK